MTKAELQAKILSITDIDFTNQFKTSGTQVTNETFKGEFLKKNLEDTGASYKQYMSGEVQQNDQPVL